MVFDRSGSRDKRVLQLKKERERERERESKMKNGKWQK